jgi:hypothetical protein
MKAISSQTDSSYPSIGVTLITGMVLLLPLLDVDYFIECSRLLNSHNRTGGVEDHVLRVRTEDHFSDA